MEGVSFRMRHHISPSFKVWNILLVDGDSSALKFTSSMLERHNARVTAVESAFLALSLIEKPRENFDIIMVDVKLRGIDVFTFMSYIRSMKKDAVVVLLTSHENDILPKTAFKNGAAFILQKPLDAQCTWNLLYGDQGIEEDSSEDSDNNNNISFSYNPWSEIKRRRIRWTEPLHLRFMDALRYLGKNANPKAILSYMNVPYLTVRHISSHLQKYKYWNTKKTKNNPLVFNQMSFNNNQRQRSNLISRVGSTSSPISNNITSSGISNTSLSFQNFQQTQNMEMTNIRPPILDIINFVPNQRFENHPENFNFGDIVEEEANRDERASPFQDLLDGVPNIQIDLLLSNNLFKPENQQGEPMVGEGTIMIPPMQVGTCSGTGGSGGFK